MTLLFRLFATLALIAALTPAAGAGSVTVFAAASLKNALDDVARAFRDQGGGPVTLSFAGSSALARQIQQGAPADLFLSANPGWMDVLERDGLIVADTRSDLLSNSLVLIGPQPGQIDLGPETDLLSALDGGRLAMALVEAVPAGIYGRMALTALGHWPELQAHVAQTDNVRSALRLVSLRETPLGIVYATDARADPNVHVLGRFPQGSHPPIVYPVAVLTEGRQDAARAFLSFLGTDRARAIFDRHGFGHPDETGPAGSSE